MRKQKVVPVITGINWFDWIEGLSVDERLLILDKAILAFQECLERQMNKPLALVNTRAIDVWQVKLAEAKAKRVLLVADMARRKSHGI